MSASTSKGPPGVSSFSDPETEMKSSVNVIGKVDSDMDEPTSHPSHNLSLSTRSEAQESSGQITSSVHKESSSTRGFSMPTISVEEAPPLPISISECIFSSNEFHKSDSSSCSGGKQDNNSNSPKNSWDMTLAQVESLPVDDYYDDDGLKPQPVCPSENVRVQVHIVKDEESETLEKVDESLNDICENGDGICRPFKRRIDSSSERRLRRHSPRNFRKALSEDGKLNEIQAEDLEKRLRALAAAFSARTRKTKEKIQQPPTPSSDEDESDELKLGEPTLLDRLRQLASPDPSEFGDLRRQSIQEKVKGRCLKNLAYIVSLIKCDYILDPQSSVYVSWLLVVSIAFLYNAWVIPLRVFFPYQTKSNVWLWVVFDSIADVVYLIDMLIFKPHVKYIEHGFWVKVPKETMRAYLRTLQFKIDIMALFPADVVVNFLDRNMPLLRLPRFLKVETFWELFRRLDTVLAHPHRARIFNTCLYMLYMIHCVACSYYALSTWEGIGATTWTFDGHGNAYIRCFYFATKTATSIGKNPKPENELEYIFMTFAWLSGVFVFAILIGQIRDIIATATKSQTEYRILTSSTVSYLHRLGVPSRLQRRVKLWLSYTWEQQKTLDETRILNLLPKNMKAEIALNIHVETLAKVKLFQNCETAFLRDLVVKLRSIIILPGDFVCRKGEIGREMFIVKSGKIQVIGGASGTQVLASLGEGSVFGEIALLGIGGMNKRTADVRAAGFVNLFVLSKADLNTAIRDYPEAQEEMRKKAKKLMKEKIKKERATPDPGESSTGDPISRAGSQVIIKNKPEAPHMITTMLKLFPPSTKIGRYLTQGSKVGSPNSFPSNKMSPTAPAADDGMIYTSFTSYPPSPFIPGSPGHISPELDISLMTGDSSDKLFSPPLESSCSCSSSDDMTSLISDGDCEETPSQDAKHNKNDSPSDNDHLENASSHLPRCPSPLPPFLHQGELSIVARTRGSLLPDIIGGLINIGVGIDNHDGQELMMQNTSATNREEIPVELRPPLYIIEPVHFGEDGGISSEICSAKDPLKKGKVSIETENRASSSQLTSHSSTSTRFIASHSQSKTRGPLERQMEVDIIPATPPMSKKERRKKMMLALTALAGGSLSYSLDFDSD